MRLLRFLFATLLLAPLFAFAQAPAPAAPSETRISPEPTFVIGKFQTTIYGFAEGDLAYDTSRIAGLDVAGMTLIPPSESPGDQPRTLFAVRNSRIGFKMQAPETMGIRSSAILEFDGVGNQPGLAPKPGYSENPFFNNPTLRIRHALLKLDTPVVSIWIGQTWQLIGWQPGFQPNSVELQGLPGEIYGRTAQLRLTRAFNFGGLTMEAAVAALRPPQMDSATPDFQAGLKFALNGWTGVQSIGQTATAVAPAQVGLSGALRHFRMASDNAGTTFQDASGHALAVDVMVPIIPASTRKAGAVTAVAEAVTGTGDADYYTGLNGNMSVGAPPGTTKYVADIDPGMAGFSTASGALSTVNWRSVLASVQIYLPPQGRLWLALAYSSTLSNNIDQFVAAGSPASSVMAHETWYDATLMADVTSAARLGLEYAHYQQTYLGGVQGVDNRVQLSGFFIF